MDKEMLRQYRDLVAECRELKQRLKREGEKTAVDMVKGSSNEFPYQSINITIEGIPTSAHLEHRMKLLRSRLQKAETMKSQIDEYIAGIEDSRTRRVFEMRYIDGWSWRKIAMRIGAADESYPRQIIHNAYLKSNPKNPKNP